jgi:hypothetical protein
MNTAVAMYIWISVDVMRAAPQRQSTSFDF